LSIFQPIHQKQSKVSDVSIDKKQQQQHQCKSQIGLKNKYHLSNKHQPIYSISGSRQNLENYDQIQRFTHSNVHFSFANIQTKLIKVSQPGDIYEQEADKIAEQVMHIPDSNSETKVLNQTYNTPIEKPCKYCYEPSLNRQVSEDDQEDMFPEQTKFEDDNEDDIIADSTGMPKRKDGITSRIPEVTENNISKGGGRHLDIGVRNFMEQRMHYDFNSIFIHIDDAAAKSSKELNALAYTVGRNIYFGNGQYNPNTFEGRKLIAHELTHVIQQEAANKKNDYPIQRQRDPSRGTNICKGDCPWRKQPRIVHNDCSNSDPQNRTNYITDLDVSVSDQTVAATWSDGTINRWDCSPNPSVTPRGRDVVGVKCGINHTNAHKDGMAWFTGFASHGMRFGFHDSQRVGSGIHSHGCVRVCCNEARIINKNTWSGHTTINVR
jgi:Domain of unknown function (DUF4157)